MDGIKGFSGLWRGVRGKSKTGLYIIQKWGIIRIYDFEE